MTCNESLEGICHNAFMKYTAHFAEMFCLDKHKTQFIQDQAALTCSSCIQQSENRVCLTASKPDWLRQLAFQATLACWYYLCMSNLCQKN